MIKLYVVSRESGPVGYFLTQELANGFARECHKAAPQDHMKCTVSESYISTYGMHVEQSRKLIKTVNDAITA